MLQKLMESPIHPSVAVMMAEHAAKHTLAPPCSCPPPCLCDVVVVAKE